jgi:hypothetical protein
MNSATKSYEKMWHKIEFDLLSIAADRYSADLPELALLCAIIIQAGRDKDEEYFTTESFYSHAKFLRISPIFIAILIKKAWNMQLSGQIWVQTPMLLEDD